ncbi:poly(A)-specific ribonuclease, partial [Coemansia sp. RSA 1694]
MSWDQYTLCWGSSGHAEGLGPPVTALAFAAESEALYAGDASGRLTTYALGGAGLALAQLAAAQCAHTPVRRLAALAGGSGGGRVFVLTDDSVQVRTAGGRREFARATTPNDPFTAAALSRTGSSDTAFVCTAAGAGSLLSLARGGGGDVVRRVAVEPSAVAADLAADALLLATAAGGLALRDPRAAGFGVVASAARAFAAGHVTDMVRADTRVFACGGSGSPDGGGGGSVVRLFDLRRLREPVADLAREAGHHEPVRLFADDRLLWIGHESGLLTTRLLADGGCSAAEPYAEPALGSYARLAAFGVAPSGGVAAVADTAGMVHVWSSDDSAEPRMSATGAASELRGLTVIIDDSGPAIDDEAARFADLRRPLDAQPLLSCADAERLSDVGRPAAHVDARVLGSLRQLGGVGYAPNPRTQRRNQQPFAGAAWRQSWRATAAAAADDSGALTRGRPKFLSQQQKRAGREGGEREGGGGEAAVDIPQQSSISASSAPTPLRRMRIEYSRFGVEDFDFSLYNATRWSGLEGDVANAHANALLQLLFFADRFRAAAVAHSSLANACADAACLSCHLGLLFRMLADAGGASCHAALLLRELAARPDAAALALLEDADGNAAATPCAVLAQRLLRFLLEQASSEIRSSAPSPIGFTQRTRSACPACGAAAERTAHVFAADLEPPQGAAQLAALLAGGAASLRRADASSSPINSSRPSQQQQSSSRQQQQQADFLALVARALARSDTTRAWCAGCRSFQLLRTDKRMTQPPAGFLALNFPVVLDAAWQLSLPTEFDLCVSTSSSSSPDSAAAAAAPASGDCCPPVRVLPTSGGAESESTSDGQSVCHMRLVAVVSSIRDTPKGAEHLVVHVREPHQPSTDDGSGSGSDGGGWLLLNDFLVQPAAEASVVSLGDWWRTPSIALYSTSSSSLPPSPVSISTASTHILTAPASVLDAASHTSHHQSMYQSHHHQKRRAAETAAKMQHEQSIPRPRVAVSAPRRNAAVPLTQAEAALLLTDRSFRCALDAEFVVLEAAKMEVFSDGTRELHRPPVHALARLSVVRANGGLLHGVPFIDDYVAATRPIEDLATQYSGIHAGDLTVGVSPHKLSTMKE